MEEKRTGRSRATQDDGGHWNDPVFPKSCGHPLVLILPLLARLQDLGCHLQQQRVDYLKFSIRVLMQDFKEATHWVLEQ